MPLDAICLSALTAELREKLEGAKIDKVQQPERDMLILSLRGRSGNFRWRRIVCRSDGEKSRH